MPVQLLWMVAAKLQMSHLIALRSNTIQCHVFETEGETSLLGLSGDRVMMSFTSFCYAPIKWVWSLLLFTTSFCSFRPCRTDVLRRCTGCGNQDLFVPVEDRGLTRAQGRSRTDVKQLRNLFAVEVKGHGRSLAESHFKIISYQLIVYFNNTSSYMGDSLKYF